MKQIKPILYSFRRCPYAMRARMALVYAGVDFELRDILLKNKPKSMLHYSPKGTVPVLVLAYKVIDESLDIMIWALQQQDKDGWDEQESQFDLIQLCDEKFKVQLDRYKYSDRYDKSEEFYRSECMWFLELLNQQIGKKSNLFSDRISLADIAIFPFIRQFAYVNKPFFYAMELPALLKWLERQLQSDLFQTIMKKNPIWSDCLIMES